MDNNKGDFCLLVSAAKLITGPVRNVYRNNSIYI